MGLIETHEPGKDKHPFRVFIEIKDGCLGRAFATDAAVQVHFYVNDTHPAVIRGMLTMPDQDLFDLTPDILTEEEYDALLRSPQPKGANNVGTNED